MADLNAFEGTDFSIFDLEPGENPLEAERPSTDVAPVAQEPETLEAQPPAVTPETPATEEQPKAESPATEPKKLEPADDDMVPVQVNGQVEYVRWGDHKGNVMRLADYTRKTMRVSEREKQVEAVAQTLQAREDKLLEIFSDKTQLDALYTKLYGQLPAAPAAQEPPPQASPDELVTNGDLGKVKGEVLTEAQKIAQAAVAAELKRVREEEAKLQATQFSNSLRSLTESTVDAVMKDHTDVLGDIPYVDTLIKKLAWDTYKPQTLDDVKTAIVEAGKALAAQFAERKRETKKIEAVKKASLDKGIETGGTPPGREARSYDTKDGGTDWDSLDRDVVRWIEAKTKR